MSTDTSTSGAGTWTIENDDDGDTEWWTVSDGAMRFDCTSEEDAHRVADFLRALQSPGEEEIEIKGRLRGYAECRACIAAQEGMQGWKRRILSAFDAEIERLHRLSHKAPGK